MQTNNFHDMLTEEVASKIDTIINSDNLNYNEQMLLDEYQNAIECICLQRRLVDDYKQNIYQLN